MKPLEILSALPAWAEATPATLLASPAWCHPCRLGETPCLLRLGAPAPAETLDIRIRLEDDEHVLGLADDPRLADLHALWASRGEVPEPILLALVEKDCGALLQLVENVAHRQLKVLGLAAAPAEAPRLGASLVFEDGAPLVFTLTSSPALEKNLGQLRFIDLADAALREQSLPAVREYASFALPAADLAALAPGDALLLPEVETLAPRLVADGRFVLAGGAVNPWQDDGLLRVTDADPAAVTLGELFDAAEGKVPAPPPAPPPANAPLRLVRAGAPVATGRLDTVGGQHAFVIDAVGA